MKTSKPIVYEWVFDDEGGYTNDPADNGGITTWGITIAEVKEWRGKKVTATDMKKYTKKEATEVYDAKYWNPLRCDDLPKGVDYIVFDAGLLHGITRSAKWLQEAVGVKVDGKIGPKTLEAVAKIPPKVILERITKSRIDRAKGHEDYKRFGKGWLNRIDRVWQRSVSLL